MIQTAKEITQPISLNLGVMTGPTSRTNLLTFGGNTIPDMDSRAIFNFLYHCRMGDFRRFINSIITVH